MCAAVLTCAIVVFMQSRKKSYTALNILEECFLNCALQALIVIKNGLFTMAEHLRETISMIPDMDVYPSFDVVDIAECLKRYKTLIVM